MAKQGRGKDPVDIARRKLADAQAKLHSAQARRGQVANQGEQEVERARQAAAARVDKATTEVERRAAKVARLEAKLITLQSRKAEPAPPKPTAKRRKKTSAPAAATSPAPSSAAEAADRFEDLQEATAPDTTANSLVTPEDVAEHSGNNGSLDQSQRRLLASLHAGFEQTGATFTEWLAASKLSKRTFLRARRILVDRGLVTHNGGGLGAKYFLSDDGRSALQ